MAALKEGRDGGGLIEGALCLELGIPVVKEKILVDLLELGLEVGTYVPDAHLIIIKEVLERLTGNTGTGCAGGGGPLASEVLGNLFLGGLLSGYCLSVGIQALSGHGLIQLVLDGLIVPLLVLKLLVVLHLSGGILFFGLNGGGYAGRHGCGNRQRGQYD